MSLTALTTFALQVQCRLRRMSASVVPSCQALVPSLRDATVCPFTGVRLPDPRFALASEQAVSWGAIESFISGSAGRATLSSYFTLNFWQGVYCWCRMATPTIAQTFKVDNSLGAAYAGNVACAIFYGVTNVQTYTYFKRCRGDGLYTKLLIVFLWMLNTLHIFFICHAIWFYAITNFANPFAIARPTWSVMASVQVTGFSDLTVRGIFCRRVWSLSERNRLITGSIILVSLFCFIMTTIFTIKGAILDNFLSWKGIAWVLYLTLTTGMVADIMLAGVQCILLKRQRDGMIKTDSTIRVLMLYAINTGAMTSVCSICCLVIYASTPPDNFGYFAFYSVLPTLLLNALLGHLNARKSLRKGLLGGGQMQQTTFALTDTTYDDSSPKPSPSRASMAPMGGPYDQMLEQNEREQIPAKLAGAPPRVSEKQGKLSPPKLNPNRFSDPDPQIVSNPEGARRPLPVPVEKDAGPLRLSRFPQKLFTVQNLDSMA